MAIRTIGRSLPVSLALGIAAALLGLDAVTANAASPAQYADAPHPGAKRQPIHAYAAHDPGANLLPQSSSAELRPAATHTQASAAAFSAANLMNYYGGVIMSHLAVRVVLGGPSWSSPQFVADKITGIDSFYTGYINARYTATADEYTGSNGTVGPTLHYQGRSTPLASSIDGTQTNQVVGAVCAEYAGGKFQPNTDGTQLIIVYSDMKRPSGNGYCGYHSATTCSGQTVEYAFLWNLDGDGGCNAGDTTTGHSQGLASLMNVTAHELHEARTDPQLNAWYDSAGNENGDKCAWTFAHASVPFSNGTKWKLQNEWSNAAYTAGTGHLNQSGQAGCVDGSN